MYGLSSTTASFESIFWHQPDVARSAPVTSCVWPNLQSDQWITYCKKWNKIALTWWMRRGSARSPPGTTSSSAWEPSSSFLYLPPLPGAGASVGMDLLDVGRNDRPVASLRVLSSTAPPPPTTFHRHASLAGDLEGGSTWKRNRLKVSITSTELARLLFLLQKLIDRPSW
jgi:hypothetical protein